MGFITRLTVRAIEGYQRHLGPRKGFTCAHSVVHKGVTCSEAVRSLVLQRGALGAVGPTLGRFAACRAAFLALPSLGFAGTDGRGLCCCGGIPIPFKF
ncbi:membrane protein insertion efficiency factor YidD [Naumannella sp. ID2617S]|nr:membrane protein insertion efficiency factor YidD [Naumannella sp. ID2617S]